MRNSNIETSRILWGDALEKIKEIPDESIDCIITSPPYWGLRDYKVEGQWGLEPTFNEWIDKMLKLTLELKRVLKKSGTFWLNIGDTYQGSGKGFHPGHEDESKEVYHFDKKPELETTLQSKCLTMIPERLAIRMIDQGWILRNKVVWHKPNSMPASVRDRLKNSYEVVYLFVKNKKYWFDLDAIRVPAKESSIARINQDLENQHGGAKQQSFEDGDKCLDVLKHWKKSNKKQDNVPSKNYQGKFAGFGEEAEKFNSPRARNERKQDNVPSKNAGLYKGFNERWKELKANKYGDDPQNLARKQAFYNVTANSTARRKKSLELGNAFYDKDLSFTDIRGANPGDVWTIATQPFKEAHFATFPEKLIQPMIEAGCPRQICSKCGFVRERQVKKEYGPVARNATYESYSENQGWKGYQQQVRYLTDIETIGWSKCNCTDNEWKAGICLDPFGGSGTVAVVAQRLNRNWIGIELKKEYIDMALNRIYKGCKPLSTYEDPPNPSHGQSPGSS